MFEKEKLEKLQENYINAKASLETMKDIEKTIHKKVLLENNFEYEPINQIKEFGKYIKNRNHSYLMSDEDFKIFIHKVHIKWLEYEPEHAEGETLWEFEKLLLEAENELLDYVKETFKKDKNINNKLLDKMIEDRKQRKKLIELTLTLSI